jgi:outer membrane protein
MKSIVVYIFLLFSFVATAQKWTLSQCIEYALNNNSQLQKYKNQQLTNEQTLLQSRASMLPTINASATHNYNWGRSIDPFTNVYLNQQVRSNNLALTGSLVLFNGFLLRNNIQSARKEVHASEADIEQYKMELTTQIVSNYIYVLMNNEKVENTLLQKQLTSEMLERSTKLKNAGVVTEGTLLDLNAQLKQEDVNVIVAQNDKELARLQLGLLLELPDPLSIEVADIDSTFSVNNPYQNADQTYNQSLSKIPQLKSLDYKKESYLDQLQSNRGRYYPRITLNGSLTTLYSTSGKTIIGQNLTGNRLSGYTSNGDDVYTYTYSTITENKALKNQLNDNFGKFVGLTMTIPILNGLQTRTFVQKSKIQLDQVDLDIKLAKLSIQKNIYTYCYQAKASEAKYNAIQESLKATNESYRNASKRYENGIIHAIELNQIKQRLNQVQTDLLVAKYDYLLKVTQLDVYTGNQLTLK